MIQINYLKYRKWVKYLGMLLKESTRKRIKRQFDKKMGSSLNLKCPTTFNEKLQWLKLYWRDPLLVALADKVEVRNYVSQKVGDKYLIPLIAVCRSEKEIVVAAEGRKSAIKMSHASGWNVIVSDEKNVDWGDVAKKCREWFASNYYFSSREFQYRAIPHRAVIEELLFDQSGRIPKDYKFHVFRNGSEVELFVQVDSDRFEDHTRNFFSERWESLDFGLQYKRGDPGTLRPVNFEEMKEVALILSEGFPYVRVDLYDTGDNVYFGELTFTPGAGYETFTPNNYDYLWGELLDLSSYTHLKKPPPKKRQK